MAILSNTPGVRYITIQGMVIEDSGVLYPISSFETCDKYIYWNRTTPFKVESSNKLETTSDLYLIALNKSGTPTLVNQTDIKVSFSGENNIGGNGTDISGIIEQVDANTIKITSLVKDVDGINSTVSKVTEDLKVTNEKVTNVEQTANGLVTTVSNLTTEYNDDKEFNLLKENITSTMINQSTLLGELSSIFKEVSKDNNLTEEEKTQVRSKKTEVESENTKLVGFITQLINSLHEQGMTENEVKLTRAKDDFVTSYNNVSKIIDTTLSSTIVVPTQISAIINGISTVVVKLTTLKDVCDDIIFLGTGGVIYGELAKISVTSNSIQQTVSSIKESIKSNLSLEKGKLQSQVDDLNAATNRLDVVIKEVYVDGTVTSIEKTLINDKITVVEKEMNDVIAICDNYLSNDFISANMKIALQKAKTDLDTVYTYFKNELNTIISDNFFNESEKDSLDVKFKAYIDSIIVFHNTISLAIDDIEKNRYEKEINNAKTLLQNQINELQQDLINMDDTINTTFKDNVIDEMERARISQNVLNLNLDKSNIDNQYNQLYKNVLLVDPLKTEFKNAYNLLNTSYNNLLKILNDILTKQTLVTNQDKINMDNGYKDLTSKTPAYVTVANKVIEFISNAEAEQSKNQFQDSISDLQNQIDNIDVSIDGAFADNLLDKAERELIKSKLDTVNLSKATIDSQFDKLYASLYLTDENLKRELVSKYNNFVYCYNDFSNFINTLITKEGLVTEQDKTQLNNYISSLNSLISEFTNTSMLVSEHIYSNQANEMIIEVDESIKALEEKLDDVENTVTEAIRDEVLDETEKIAIEQSMLNLQSQKIQLDNEYTLIYNNVNLSVEQKKVLSDSKVLFDNKYNALVASINNILSKVDKITEQDRLAYENAYNEYKVELGKFRQVLGVASNQIYEKITNDAKKELDEQIKNVSQSLADLNNFMNGAFADGILDSAERSSLKTNLDNLKIKKVEIDNSYNQTYKNVNLSSSVKTALKTAYDSYMVKYNALISFIEGLLASEDNVNDSHKIQLETLLNNHNIELAKYIVQYNIAIEDISKNYTNSTKNELQNQINGVNNSVNDLENTMNGVFQDGVLSSAEKLAIKERLQLLQSEKVNVDKQYETLVANKDLIDVSSTEKAKTNLINAYINLGTSYTTLVNAINTFVEVTGIVDDTHRLPVTNAFNDYKSKLGTYSTRVNEAVDAIAKKKVSDEATIREEKIVKLTQDLDGFKFEVSENYSTKTEHSTLNDLVVKNTSELSILKDSIDLKVEESVSKIGIGANNHIYNSSEFQNLDGWVGDATIVEGNIKCLSEGITNTTDLEIIPGETYVFSATVNLPVNFVMTENNILDYILKGGVVNGDIER